MPFLQRLWWFWWLSWRAVRANPLNATLMELHQVLHPLLWHLPAGSSYLGLFLSKASSIQSSLGIVSSSKTTCLVVSDIRTVSGLSVVSTMFSGNLSCLPRWTFSCQSCTVASSPPGRLRCWCGFCLASTKWWTALLVAAVYSWRSHDDLCNDLQHLVMSPMARNLIQCGSDYHNFFHNIF